MTFKKFLLIFFISIVRISLSSQNVIPKYPPTPELINLGIYGQIPTSAYTGKANITIPIFTIELNDINVPISLNYNTGGITVDEIASWVGLGWNLTAGGVITRINLGEDDFFANRVGIKTFEQLKQKDFPTHKVLEDIIESGYYDGEPDIFYYNFCGYNGTFIIDEAKNIRLLDDNKQLLSVEYDNQEIQGIEYTTIIITNNKGIKYFFNREDGEYTTYRTQKYSYKFSYKLEAQDISDIEKYIQNGWYLSKIVALNGEYVQFYYLKDTICQESSMQGIMYYDDYDGWLANNFRMTVCLHQSPPNTYTPPPPDMTEIEINSNYFTRKQTENISRKILKIVCSNGIEINFINQKNFRKDLPTKTFFPGSKPINNYVLDKIEIIGNGKKTIWSLGYTHFNSNIINENSDDADRIKSEWYYRLILKQICLLSENFDTLNRYKFEYYGEKQNEKKLPHRYSYSCKDYYGYCNGESNSSNSNDIRKIFPNIENETPENYTYIGYLFYNPSNAYFINNNIIWDMDDIYSYSSVSYNQGSDFEPNIEYSKAYSIKTVYYPTGGSTTFEYELNDASCVGNQNSSYPVYNKPIGGLRVKKIINKSIFGKDETIEYKYLIDTVYYQSSGVITDLPKWIFRKTLHNSTNCSIRYLKTALSSQPLNSMSVFGGGTIEYKKIFEYKNNKLQTIYEYHTRDEYTLQKKFDIIYVGVSQDNQLPVTFAAKINKPFYPNYNIYYNSQIYTFEKLKCKKIFDQMNNLTKEEKYFYSFKDFDTIYGLSVSRMGSDNYNLRGLYYYFVSGCSYLDSIENKNYFYSNNESSTTKKTTYYEYDNFNLPRLVTEKINNNLTTINVNRYPYNFVDINDTTSNGQNEGSIFYNALWYMVKNKNINSLIESTQLLKIGDDDSKVINSTLTLYKCANNNNNLTLPYKNLKFESDMSIYSYLFNITHSHNKSIIWDDRYETEIEYTKFDEKGYLEEYKYNNDLFNTIVWDKKYKIPIAFIKSTNVYIFFMGFEINDKFNDWTIPLNNIQTTSESLNGDKCFKSDNKNQTIKTPFLISNRSYRIRLFAKTNSSGYIKIENQIHFLNSNKYECIDTIVKINNQAQINIDIYNCKIDDIFILPYESEIFNYAYIKRKLNYIFDNNGKKTYFEYDNFNYLKTIYENENYIKKFIQYQFYNKTN